MKVVTVDEFGSPDVLRLIDAPDLRPVAGAAVVKVEAIGLGYMDTAARRGESYLAAAPGFTPGYEIAGVVTEIGEGVETAWLDQRVFAVLRSGGGCAEFAQVPTSELICLPAHISYENAVATGLNALVAQVGSARIPMSRSDRVLVRGAGGGIGLMCVQYAALRAGEIVATTSSEQRGERLRELGATSVWNRLAERDEDSGQFNVVIDTVIGAELPRFLDKLANNGHYMMCGGVGGMPPNDFGTKILEHFHRSPTLYAFSLNSPSVEAVGREAAVLFDHVEAGRVSPVIDAVLPLNEVVEAHRKLDAGGAFGKIVLKPA